MPNSIIRRPRLHFAIRQQLLPLISDGVINGLVAWALHPGNTRIGLWDNGSYATDLLATGFLLPAITWMILRPILLRRAIKGAAPELAGLSTPLLSPWIPRGFWSGAIVTGLMGTVLFGVGGSVLMHALGAPTMTGHVYALFKAGYAGVLAAALQPAMVFAILGTSRVPALHST